MAMAAFRILRGSIAYSATLEQSQLASLRTLMSHSTYSIPVYRGMTVSTVGITQCILNREFVIILLIALHLCNSQRSLINRGIRF